MTKNQRSGLSDKAERFQKWSQDGNISGYAHFLSSRENRRFYTKCSFDFWILVFVEEKYKAFFVIYRQTLQGSFSAVSKPNFASKIFVGIAICFEKKIEKKGHGERLKNENLNRRP